jgi:hypothetical protein
VRPRPATPPLATDQSQVGAVRLVESSLPTRRMGGSALVWWISLLLYRQPSSGQKLINS